METESFSRIKKKLLLLGVWSRTYSSPHHQGPVPDLELCPKLCLDLRDNGHMRSQGVWTSAWTPSFTKDSRTQTWVRGSKEGFRRVHKGQQWMSLFSPIYAPSSLSAVSAPPRTPNPKHNFQKKLGWQSVIKMTFVFLPGTQRQN